MRFWPLTTSGKWLQIDGHDYFATALFVRVNQTHRFEGDFARALLPAFVRVERLILDWPPEESPAREAGDGSVVNVLGRGLVTDLALLCRRDQRIWPRLVSGIVLPWLPFRFPGIWYFDAFRGRRKWVETWSWWWRGTRWGTRRHRVIKIFEHLKMKIRYSHKTWCYSEYLIPYSNLKSRFAK